MAKSQTITLIELLLAGRLTQPALTWALQAEVAKLLPLPPQNLSVPNNDAIPATDFISYILAFEKSYHPDTVLAAFEKALPAFRTASTESDRIFIFYKSIRSLS